MWDYNNVINHDWTVRPVMWSPTFIHRVPQPQERLWRRPRGSQRDHAHQHRHRLQPRLRTPTGHRAVHPSAGGGGQEAERRGGGAGEDPAALAYGKVSGRKETEEGQKGKAVSCSAASDLVNGTRLPLPALPSITPRIVLLRDQRCFW